MNTKNKECIIKMKSPIDIKALQALDKVFKKNDIPYWLTCGTLLGAVREGKPIEWDWDIDIAIFFKDLLRVYFIRKEFEKYGYAFKTVPKPGIWKDNKHVICVVPIKIYSGQLTQMYGWDLIAKMGHFVDRDLASVCEDRCLMSRLPNHLLFLLSLLFNQKRLKWGEYKWLGNFAYVEMCGDYYPIPEHVEEYLKYKYRDWRTPLKGVAWLKQERIINAAKWSRFDEKACLFEFEKQRELARDKKGK